MKYLHIGIQAKYKHVTINAIQINKSTILIIIPKQKITLRHKDTFPLFILFG